MVLAAILAQMGGAGSTPSALTEPQLLADIGSQIATVNSSVKRATRELVGGADDDGCYDGLVFLYLGVGENPEVNYIIPSTNTEDGYLQLIGGASISANGIDLTGTSQKAYSGFRASNIYDQGNIGYTLCTKNIIGPSSDVEMRPVAPDGTNEASADYYFGGYGLDSKVYPAIWASSSGIAGVTNEAGYHDFQRVEGVVEYRTNSNKYTETVALGSISDAAGGVALVGDGVAQSYWIWAGHRSWDETKSNAWRARCLTWLSAVKSYRP